MPHGRARDWNLALFDLGATLCIPEAPRCGECPISEWCEARRQGRQADFPQLAPRTPIERQIDVGLVIRDAEGRILMLQRSSTGVWAGMWEVPRGTVYEGESLEAAAERIAQETLGVSVTLGDSVATIRHTVMRRSITLHAIEATLRGNVRTGRWVTSDEASTLALPSPQRKLLMKLSL